MKRLYALFLLCAWAHAASGQITGDTLKGAEVIGERPVLEVKQQFSHGMKMQTIEPLSRLLYRHESLAELLAANTTAFVRATGLNTFSTLSLRGASSAQSAVYWEGVPLMNGATGIADISLLPVSSMRGITVNYGSSGALWGSGNVGGAIMMQDERPLFVHNKWRGEIEGGAGSFGHYSGLGSMQWLGKKFFVSGAGSAVRAENDFGAVDERGNRFSTENARQRSYNANLTLGYKAGKRGLDELIGRLWLYHYDRQIPRALFESGSVKQQRDRGFRAMLHWEHGRNTEKRHYLKAALLSNEFNYSDSSIGLYSEAATRQAFAEAGIQRRIGARRHLLLFAPVQRFWLARSPDTAQNRIAIAGAFSYDFFRKRLAPNNYRLNVAANFRLESFDGTGIALPGMNAVYELSSDIRIRANAQYTYRAPTLNELYYQPGGNPALKPERGWSVDGGYDWTKGVSHEGRLVNWRFYQSGSAYNRLIKDWIIWLGGAIWTPHNLAAVHSRGLELENSLEGFLHNATSWKLSIAAAYTRSTPTESYLPGDNSIGRQIPYVPLTTVTATARFGWRDLTVFLNTVVTGHRFVTSDESQRLPGYTLSGLRIAYNFSGKQALYHVQLSLNNIFNERYAVVAYRPMPGFNWSLSAGINLGKRD